jgi:hypothetical protein
MSKFQDAMRRVITGDNAGGQSVIIIDGGPKQRGRRARPQSGRPKRSKITTARDGGRIRSSG